MPSNEYSERWVQLNDVVRSSKAKITIQNESGITVIEDAYITDLSIQQRHSGGGSVSISIMSEMDRVSKFPSDGEYEKSMKVKRKLRVSDE